MEFIETVKARYSCRKYSADPIPQDKLEQVLEAGRLAPTAKNLQEQHVYVIRSEEGLAKIDAAPPCRFGAPVVLAVAYDKTNVFTYPGGRLNSGAEDATIVATHMALAAKDAGLDSCWLNFFDPDLLAASLGLPEQEELVMLLDLGYASAEAAPSGNHASRKPLSETVSYL